MLPFSIENGVKGSPNKQKVTIDKIEINPVIEDSRFKMPATTTAPAGNKPAVKPENKESESKPADKKPPMVTKKPA